MVTRLLFGALAVVFLAKKQVFSLPEFWDQRGECNVPTRAYGGHKAPIWDHEIVVLIVSTTKDGGSLAVSSFEPGQQYSISVVNSKENKGTHCWLHASEGQFHRDWSNGQATSCGNAALTYATNIEHLFEWTAPSSEECVKFSVVMASGADKPYSRSEVDFCVEHAQGPASHYDEYYDFLEGVVPIEAPGPAGIDPNLEQVLSEKAQQAGDLDTAVLVATIAVVLVCILTCSILLLCCYYRRRRAARTSAPKTVEPEGTLRLSHDAVPYSYRATSLAAVSAADREQSSLDVARNSNGLFDFGVQSKDPSGVSSMYASAYPTKYSTVESVFTRGPSPVEVPGESSSPAERMEYVQYQIDSLNGVEVLNGLIMDTSMHSRLTGGQAVIQFAKEKHSTLEYAIKFYLSKAAFGEEAALYTDSSSPLGKFLPVVRNIVPNDDLAFKDSHAAPMPPCICMEKGESLDMWTRRNPDGVDMITGLQVIHHIAARLSDLHEAGYCHRDLKPGNVMWLPRHNRWTLIDFGCAARIGEEARIGYSLAYAAPEVIQSVRDQQQTMTPSDKVDAWSLGVMAVELLTNRPPFNLLEGSKKVMDRIVGELPLPWEDADTAPALLRRFGHFKLAVMNLLQREPSKRPSMKAFLKDCNRVLMHTTRTGNSAVLNTSPNATTTTTTVATEGMGLGATLEATEEVYTPED